jgi:hypothetical protein
MQEARSRERYIASAIQRMQAHMACRRARAPSKYGVDFVDGAVDDPPACTNTCTSTFSISSAVYGVIV